VFAGAPVAQRKQDRHDELVASPPGGGFDRDERLQIEDTNLRWPIPEDGRVRKEIVVIPAVMQHAERIEGAERGGEAELPAARQQSSSRPQVSSSQGGVERLLR